MNYIELFAQSVAAYRDSFALADGNGGERKITYGELDLLSGRVAGKLKQSGIRRNAFVLVCMERSIEYLAAYLGILKAGCAVVPVVPEYPKERIAAIREDCRASAMITGAFFDDVGGYEPVCEPADGTEPGIMVYTSGSTGKPKGILLSAGDMARAAKRNLRFETTEEPIRFGACCSLAFAAHFMEYETIFLLGGCVYILPEEARRSARAIETYFNRSRITMSFISPQLLRLIRAEIPSLVRVITGSERVSGIHTDKYELVNIYGMSEVVIASCFRIDRPYDNTPIGRALDGVELRIVDADGHEVPDGTEGEICMVGQYDCLYFGDPERTARVMVRQPDGRTLVHSGDVGFRNEAGDVVFVNRMDWMVKINGQRVETLEIETLLLRAPGVENAAVKAFEDENGQTYLVAYYVSEKADEGTLRKLLQRKLPAYMIPRFFVRLDALPKNRNGKLDRNALCPPALSLYKSEYVPPQNETERRLCEGFEAVLSCGRAGAKDDFFALGGDSIKVLKLLDAVGDDRLTIGDVLSGRTPGAIASLLVGRESFPAEHASEIPAVCPMTESQKGVYLECIEAPDSVMYNIPMLFRLPEGIREKRLIEAVKTAVSGHRALFVTAGAPGGVPSMLYGGETEVAVAKKTVESIGAECRAFVRPFDLENGPLYRFELVKSGKEKVLLADIHHLVFDGTSLGVLLNGICAAYDGKKRRDEALTLFDLSRAEQTLKGSEIYRRAQAFFRERFEGLDADSRPVSDRVEENPPEGAGRVEAHSADSLDSGIRFTADEVASFVKKHAFTENTLFLGAFAYALAKFNGAKDSLFTAADSGRNDPRLMNSVGMFVKTLPLYFEIDETQSVKEFLTGVQSLFFGTMQHDCISFGELAAAYGVSDAVSFVYQAELFAGAETECGTIGAELLDTDNVQSDLNVMVLKEGKGYRVLAKYRKELYTGELIRSFVGLYFSVVRGLLTAKTLGDFALTDERSEASLRSFNETERRYDGTETVVSLFRKQAKKTPDHGCVVFGERKYTYREADALSDRLAARLVQDGVGKEKVVGILIPRSEYMVLCSLGVLKAGGGYLPLDPSYPPERLNLMVKDSGAMLLITTPELDPLIGDGFAGRRMMADEILTLPDADAPLPEPEQSDLFVLLYTSGSTGMPKGVMFEHSNTLVTARFVKDYFAMGEQSKALSYASYGFDAHTFEIYPALISGAELHVIPEELRLDLPALRSYCNENGVTHAVMTTQVGRQFALMGGHRTLKHLSVAGEKLTPLAPPEGLAFYNLYGPTEGSVITSAFRMEKRYSDVPIGKAVDNLKLYVVDGKGRLLPAGAAGELWIAGPHVTRGYLNRPEKTAEAYGENPFCDAPGYERVYRTGDVVRLLHDGNLQFIGRRDAQVKVRGFRVELTEVEEVIRRFAGVRDATVRAFDAPSGGKYIAAYVVTDGELDVGALNGFIRAEKPPYMVPAVTMRIDSIPLTPNGKVNKRALPLPQRKALQITPPETEAQKRIFALVEKAVGHSDFGIDTDVYEAGLTSIGALQLNVALGDAFGVAVKIRDIREHPTVRGLEGFVCTGETGGKAVGTEAAEEANGPSAELLPDYPLSAGQSGVFAECLSNPGTTVYNMPLLLKLGCGIDPDRLLGAVKSAIDAHPYLKLRLFADGEGNVRAERRDGDAPEVGLLDADALPEAEKLVLPFELTGGKLYRAAVYRTNGGNYLFFDMHHLVGDGVSESILLADIEKAYAGITPEKETYTGFEYAREEEKLRGGREYEQAKSYYDALLGGCDGECLPPKAPGTEETALPSITRVGSDISAVEEYCRRHDVTPNAFWNGVFGFVLGRFGFKEEPVFATVYNGRNDSRLSSSVAMLVKTVPVLAVPDGKKTVEEYLRGIGSQLLQNMENDLFSFAEISRAYGVKADMIFVYQGDSFAFDTFCGEKAERIPLPLGLAKAPFTLNVYIRGGKAVYEAEYRKDCFCAAFAESFVDALDEAAKEFTRRETLKEVSLCADPVASYRVLNDNAAEVGDVPSFRLFTRQAEAHPGKVAVVSHGERMTFEELDRRSNRIAHALRRLGVGGDSIVGMLVNRGTEIPLAELGILKAGGAFLPMLPDYPDDRVDYCLTDAESRFVVTTREIKAAKSGLFADGKPYRALTLEELQEEPDDTDPKTEIAPDELAYCIYTSGSTGKPKGVMIAHRNLTNFMITMKPLLRFLRDEAADGTALAVSSVSFDMSICDLLLPLFHGKTCCIATEEEVHNPALLMKLLADERVEMIVCTPSFMTNLLSIPGFAPSISGLKSLIVGAEAFPASLFDALRSASPGLQIINGYGPSETTICCCVKELKGGEKVTIGRPTGNVRMYVTDRFGNVLPRFASGELIIAGAGVGRGYVKLPDKTREAFFTLYGQPAYHSGDLVRLDGNDEIEFFGRLDNQVKIRGFRVELDEVENVMCAFDGVKQSKVVVRSNGSEDYLAGFFTADKKVDLSALTEFMKSKLTYYMVPAVLLRLDVMPLTANGKIDKKALPEVKKESRREKKRSPKKSLEERLCEIFRSVLSLDECFADDDFFELGGTSLSASKVTMRLMSEGIRIEYGDIFDHPSPGALADFIESRGREEKAEAPKQTTATGNETDEALKYNTTQYANRVKRESLGNVLLTGATGFLGIHVLRELIASEEGHLYCLVRRGSSETSADRVKTLMMYYFDDPYLEAFRDKITVFNADITDEKLEEILRDIPFDTVINCAACVKHFSNDDTLERINVHGVENLIRICKKRNARLIQISTVSIPGVHTEDSYARHIKMYEDEFFVIDSMMNKYVESKYKAEQRMLAAIRGGLRGKIIRVGNLMGRHSDGEFQINFNTNMFLSGIRGFAAMGMYPISHMTDPMRFSPVDYTAKAIVLLAGTNDIFTAFNADNRYGFDEMKLIDACNRNDIPILPAEDAYYYEEYNRKLADSRMNATLNGLAAYDRPGMHMVETDNLFTTNILYRLGFSWPLIDDAYLDKTIHSMVELDYFDTDAPEDKFSS